MAPVTQSQRVEHRLERVHARDITIGTTIQILGRSVQPGGQALRNLGLHAILLSAGFWLAYALLQMRYEDDYKAKRLQIAILVCLGFGVVDVVAQWLARFGRRFLATAGRATPPRRLILAGAALEIAPALAVCASVDLISPWITARPIRRIEDAAGLAIVLSGYALVATVAGGVNKAGSSLNPANGWAAWGLALAAWGWIVLSGLDEGGRLPQTVAYLCTTAWLLLSGTILLNRVGGQKRVDLLPD